MTNTPDPIAEQLDEWRERYANRRTVSWQMLNEAARLVEASQRYHARLAQAEIARVEDRLAALEEQHASELERAEQRLEQQRNRAERAEAAEQAYRKQQTNLREERETVDDGVQVRIEAPRIPGYGDRTHPRPWTLGELETMMYRLRAGGATDDTEVRFKHEHAEACIPFPEMVLEPTREVARRPEPRLPDPGRRPSPSWPLRMKGAAAHAAVFTTGVTAAILLFWLVVVR